MRMLVAALVGIKKNAVKFPRGDASAANRKAGVYDTLLQQLHQRACEWKNERAQLRQLLGT